MDAKAIQVGKSAALRRKQVQTVLTRIRQHAEKGANLEDSRQRLWGSLLNLTRNAGRIRCGNYPALDSTFMSVVEADAEQASAFLASLKGLFSDYQLQRYDRLIDGLDVHARKDVMPWDLGQRVPYGGAVTVGDLRIQEMPMGGYEKILFAEDLTGLGFQAFIAIDSLIQGPAIGGLRMLPYLDAAKNPRRGAFLDVLRLSRGMTHKSAVSENGLGGGKAVSIGDPTTQKTREWLRLAGQFVDILNGLYWTAEDANMDLADLDVVAEFTPYVTGISRPGSSGDPSPYTVAGVRSGLTVVVREVLKREDFRGVHFVLPGMGNVGSKLAESLLTDGAELTIADVDVAKLEKFRGRSRVSICEPEQIYDGHQGGQIFVPCAFGNCLNTDTIPRLAASRILAVAGPANNQLGEAAHAVLLRNGGILYAPDFVMNPGGIDNIAVEMEAGGYQSDRAMARAMRVGGRLELVFRTARGRGMTTQEAAVLMAENNLRGIEGGFLDRL